MTMPQKPPIGRNPGASVPLCETQTRPANPKTETQKEKTTHHLARLPRTLSPPALPSRPRPMGKDCAMVQCTIGIARWAPGQGPDAADQVCGGSTKIFLFFEKM